MKALTPFVFTTLTVICGCVSPYEAGRRDAHRDIAHGTLALEAFGTAREGFPDYEALLKQKYGVTIRWVASNNVPAQVLEHWKGYNEVAKLEIERRFGTTALQQAQEEASATYERKSQGH